MHADQKKKATLFFRPLLLVTTPTQFFLNIPIATAAMNSTLAPSPNDHYTVSDPYLCTFSSDFYW